jgi:hypothetical protein
MAGFRVQPDGGRHACARPGEQPRRNKVPQRRLNGTETCSSCTVTGSAGQLFHLKPNGVLSGVGGGCPCSRGPCCRVHGCMIMSEPERRFMGCLSQTGRVRIYGRTGYFIGKRFCCWVRCCTVRYRENGCTFYSKFPRNPYGHQIRTSGTGTFLTGSWGTKGSDDRLYRTEQYLISILNSMHAC